MIPKDPMILLSYVNTQLRDYYDSLEALCTCRGLKKDELVAKMHSIDYEYDEATGDSDNGIAAGTKFEDIPEDWVCPLCGAGKSEFKKS